jgi:hypothetical protein
MHKYVLGLTILLLVFVAVVPSSRSTGLSHENTLLSDTVQPMTIRGSIWDSVCAAAGSHGKMMAKLQVKDVKECTLGCVANGAELVLFNSDDKTIFRVDSQDKVKEYAGQTVTVTGNYDRATGILHVDSINTVAQ